MHVAREKLKTNIGEYFLYMFQIEDLLRACQLEPSIINDKIISRYQSNINHAEIKQWYLGLAELLKEEKKEEKGHLQFLSNKINEVHEFHLYLLNNPDEQEYSAFYLKIQPIIDELQRKSTANENVLSISLNAIYGFILLKISSKQISPETYQGINQLVSWLNLISKKFRDYEKGNLQIEK